MESLIPVISKLQDVFSTIGESEIQLPQIVVIGSQSAGKTSVIEGIVGRDFLPRGIGIVTRRPLLLHLTYVPVDSLKRKENLVDRETDWAVFEHIKNQIFTDFEKVRQEIDDETKRITGSNKGVSTLPINLKIFSHKVVNLSLIDLPGITKVPVGDQPPDIEFQIRQMICKYISNPNSLILAVTPANQDFATSEPLKLAKEFDPEGNRTLAVLTKLDLMDNGTDAMDVLTGKIVPVKLGIIGIVNRSQADIKNKKTIEDCLNDEIKYLHKKYPTLASTNGIYYLSKTLNRLLMHHICKCLPQLKNRINTMIQQSQTLLYSYGETVVDKNRTLLYIITNFANAYNSTIEGTSKNIDTSEICGGARICYIFYETLRNALEKVNPMENLTKWDILTAIRNATGPKTAIFIPEISFELLVKRQIRRLEEPCLKCVDLVYDELIRIVQNCGIEIQHEMQRFPKLYDRLNEVITNVLMNRLSPTKEFVSNLIAIQLAYINTRHPEFNEVNINLFKESSLSSDFNNINFESNMNTLKPSNEIASVELTNNVNGNFSTTKQMNGSGSKVGSWLFSRTSQNTQSNLVNQTIESTSSSNLTESIEKNYKRDMSPKEKRDCEIIEKLIREYFIIVKRTIQDLVPKSIMYFLVNYVKENLQNELVQQLYNHKNIDELLVESNTMSQRRKECAETLQALKKANFLINEIRELPVW